MIAFLDAVMEDFIIKLEELRDHKEVEKRRSFEFMERAYNFAKDNRALGLGVLGYHSLLQAKGLAFEEDKAAKLNKEVFKHIKEKADASTKQLAKELGEPEVLKGYGRRNTTTMAIAPTTSSAFILGQVSQGIEPIWSNCYIKDVAKMKVTIKNPTLKALLKKKDKDTKATWDSIRDNDGSVQHLDCLSNEEKKVFRTFAEVHQGKIIDQAGDRQKYIDQGQSLNIMLAPDTPVKDINQLYIKAWKQGIKSLYYQHSMNAAQQMARKKLSAKDTGKSK
jgi:ribonucleoside-diphosphate reductase alpha chain